MSNKKINSIGNIVLPVVVIAITIALFFMFKPEETTALFYINLAYVIVLEAVFFGYLNLLHVKTEEVSSPFFAIFGVYSLYYIVLGLGWLLLYWLVLKRFDFAPLKVYTAGLMILTLLWIIISVLTMQTDSNYRQTVDKLKNDGLTLDFYTQKIALLAKRYENLCNERGMKYETDSNNSTVLDRLKGKIEFLTPNVLKNETTAAQLASLLGKCEDIIDETESAAEEQLSGLSKKMQRFVEASLAEVDMLRNLTRS